MSSQTGNNHDEKLFMLVTLRVRSPNFRARVSHTCRDTVNTIDHLLSGEVFQ